MFLIIRNLQSRVKISHFVEKTKKRRLVIWTIFRYDGQKKNCGPKPHRNFGSIRGNVSVQLINDYATLIWKLQNATKWKKMFNKPLPSFFGRGKMLIIVFDVENIISISLLNFSRSTGKLRSRWRWEILICGGTS